MINYQQLEALHAVISEAGFEKAAAKLFITQSAVSRRIQQLELLLGEPVLVRSQPPKATAAGQRLLNHLQQVLQLEFALGINALNSHYSADEPLTVRLATNADSLATWLPQALVVSEAEIDGRLRFELLVEDQSVILKRMKAGEVMVCISASAEPVNGGLVSYLGALRYQAIASPAFIQRYGSAVGAELAKVPCLVFDEHDKLQHQFLRDVAQCEPEFVHYCPLPEGFKQAMIAGLGYGLLPEIQLGDAIAKGELALFKPGYVLDTPLYWHYWQTESPQLKALRQHALKVAAKYLVQV